MNSLADRVVLTVSVLGIMACVSMSAVMAYFEPPVPQLTIPCQVVRVIDGDTIEVEIRTRFNVRLLDCWAPEKHQTDVAGEKPLGLASEAAMKALAEGKAGIVSIPLPSSPETSLASVFTLGRVLGRVSVEGADLSEQQRKSGHAFATKDELQADLKRRTQ